MRIGGEYVPGDKECSVIVRGMAVILDVLTLLPDAEVVESSGSIETHCGPFLLWVKHQWKCDQEIGLTYRNVESSNCSK